MKLILKTTLLVGRKGNSCLSERGPWSRNSMGTACSIFARMSLNCAFGFSENSSRRYLRLV